MKYSKRCPNLDPRLPPSRFGKFLTEIRPQRVMGSSIHWIVSTIKRTYRTKNCQNFQHFAATTAMTERPTLTRRANHAYASWCALRLVQSCSRVTRFERHARYPSEMHAQSSVERSIPLEFEPRVLLLKLGRHVVQQCRLAPSIFIFVPKTQFATEIILVKYINFTYSSCHFFGVKICAKIELSFF